MTQIKTIGSDLYDGDLQSIHYSPILRGFLFVHMYATYEFSVKGAVQAALASIDEHNIAPQDIKPQVLSLLLDSEWKAAADASRQKIWYKRINLANTIISSDPLDQIDDTVFPSDGSQYRPTQLKTIWTLLDIADPIVQENRHLGRIEEIVENRNVIAHGNETPESIGRRYSTLDLLHRIHDVELIINHIVDTVHQHCQSNKLLK